MSDFLRAFSKTYGRASHVTVKFRVTYVYHSLIITVTGLAAATAVATVATAFGPGEGVLIALADDFALTVMDGGGKAGEAV